MTNTIIDTGDIAAENWDGDPEAQLDTTMTATKDPEHVGIEFHVSMRDHTLHDMEELIVQAAAAQLLGGHRLDSPLAKRIEEAVLRLTSQKVDAALEPLTIEILNQPMMPNGQKEPMTMRDFIGLAGREFLEQYVDPEGRPAKYDQWSKNEKRIEKLVRTALDKQFSNEIKKATDAVIYDFRQQTKAAFDAMLTAEKTRIAEALAYTVKK